MRSRLAASDAKALKRLRLLGDSPIHAGHVLITGMLFPVAILVLSCV